MLFADCALFAACADRVPASASRSMLVLPGPAIIVIPLGLAVLAVEFAWARRWLERLRDGSRLGLGRSRDHAV